MREYVFTDPALRAIGDSFVWLSVDTERPENAAFLDRFPSTSLPTLWVIDSANEQAVLKWIGAATAPELRALLEDAAAALSAHDSGGIAGAAFLAGNQATGAGKLDEAVLDYQKALTAAPEHWPKRPQTVEALSARLSDLDRYAQSIALAKSEVPRLPPGTPQVNVLVNALNASDSLPKDDPLRADLSPLIENGTQIAEDPRAPILVDDRSGLYESLVATLHNKNPPEAKRLARAWASLLEGEAERAVTPRARAVWDAHRLSAYMELGEVAKALPMLQASEHDFPEDYNPPARLARAYYELKRFDEAKDAMGRAEKLVYGPRQLRLLLLKADIFLATGDRVRARQTLEDARDRATNMHLPANYERLRALLKRRVDELG